MAQQVGLRGPKTAKGKVGISLEENQLDHFDGQQIYQLYELRQSISPISESSSNTNEHSSDLDFNPPKKSSGSSNSIKNDRGNS